jgi:hypothetical protein
MKRLVDESTDELTRSLLVAGIEHRPPQRNKATVIVALGAGGALGLFSSNALAWLGTTAGKVTAVGAAVGIAGAVFVAVPALQGDSGPRAGATASRGAPPIATAPGAAEHDMDAPEKARPEPGNVGAPRQAGTSEGPSPLDERRDGPLYDGPLYDGQLGEAAGGNNEANAQLAVAGEVVEGGSVAGSVDRKGVDRKGARSSARSTSKKPHRAGASRSGKRLAAGGRASEAPKADEAVARTSAEKDRLDAEVRLIDDMHWAARRNDRAALARSVQTYRETFPDGQLKAEAAEFAARLERSDAP